jgi:hypothetical protein
MSLPLGVGGSGVSRLMARAPSLLLVGPKSVDFLLSKEHAE